jgi:hypothetical protein
MTTNFFCEHVEVFTLVPIDCRNKKKCHVLHKYKMYVCMYVCVVFFVCVCVCVFICFMFCFCFFLQCKIYAEALSLQQNVHVWRSSGQLRIELGSPACQPPAPSTKLNLCSIHKKKMSSIIAGYLLSAKTNIQAENTQLTKS